MIKKSLICGVFLLSIPFLAASCANLRDADRCYRVARLMCEKSECEVDDHTECIETQKNLCHDDEDEELDSTWLDECADKLAALDECAGSVAVNAACAAPGEATVKVTVGATCSSYSDCADGLSCLSGMCTTSCFYDPECSGYGTGSGGTTYCNGTNGNSGVCLGTCQSSAECRNGWVCQPNGSVKTCGPNLGSNPGSAGGKLGDPCDSSSDCDAGQCSLGYCTTTCSSQSTCSGLTSDGGSLSCARVTGLGSYGCWPSCTSSSDCASGSVCKSQQNLDGSLRSVCFEESSSPATGNQRFGQSCEDATDCSDSAARCEAFCTTSCASDSQCSATSSTGLASRCAQNAVPGSSLCLPGCKPGVSGQCAVGSSCVAVQLPTGLANLCRPDASSDAKEGLVGDPCEINTDCSQPDSLSCTYGMCTKSCTQEASCPDTSGSKESICASIISNLPGSSGCTYSCDNEKCLPGWVCSYDPNVGTDVCMHSF